MVLRRVVDQRKCAHMKIMVEIQASRVAPDATRAALESGADGVFYFDRTLDNDLVLRCLTEARDRFPNVFLGAQLFGRAADILAELIRLDRGTCNGLRYNRTVFDDARTVKIAEAWDIKTYVDMLGANVAEDARYCDICVLDVKESLENARMLTDRPIAVSGVNRSNRDKAKDADAVFVEYDAVEMAETLRFLRTP